MASKLSFLLPSRERAAQCKAAITNIKTNTKGIDYEILLAIDADDSQRNEYETITNIDVLVVMEQRTPPGACCNVLMNAVSGNIVIPHSDDIEIRTPDYCEQILKKIKQIDDPYFVLQPFSGISWQPTIMFFSIDFIRETGYLSTPLIQHWYADTWIADIAQKSCGLYRMPNVLFFHNHYLINPNAMDATYQHQHRDNGEVIKKDKATYDAAENELERSNKALHILSLKYAYRNSQLASINKYGL